MTLTCRNLLRVPYANRMELVTGETGLGNVVLRTHILEIAEYMDFVQKGDFIITIGYVLKNDKAKWQDFIYQLSVKEVAGLAIDTERLDDSTVELIKNTCIECECPLFIMPVEMRIPDLQESISRILYEESMKSMLAEKFFLELMYNNAPVSQSKMKRAEKYGFDNKSYYYFIDIELCFEKCFDLQDKSKIKQTYKGISGDIYTIYEENPIEQIKTILYGGLNETNAKNYIIVNGENISVLASNNPENIKDIVEKIQIELGELEIEYKIGISSKNIGIDNMNICYEQSVFARKGCSTINSAMYFENFGIEAMIHNSSDDSLLDAICESILGSVLNMEDKDKREEILETLDRFMEHNCNYDETAEILYCHSNTVRNRISDIEKRLGISHTNFNDMFNIKLAMAIYHRDRNTSYMTGRERIFYNDLP